MGLIRCRVCIPLKLRPCYLDNEYLYDDRSHIKVHIDERIRVLECRRQLLANLGLRQTLQSPHDRDTSVAEALDVDGHYRPRAVVFAVETGKEL